MSSPCVCVCVCVQQTQALDNYYMGSNCVKMLFAGSESK